MSSVATLFTSGRWVVYKPHMSDARSELLKVRLSHGQIVPRKKAAGCGQSYASLYQVCVAASPLLCSHSHQCAETLSVGTTVCAN